MRVTNLIFHIITMIIMLPDLVFVGLNSLVGLGYCNGIELVYVLTADLRTMRSEVCDYSA